MKTTQKARLKAFFESRPGQWISLRDILDLRMSQFGARILELRRSGMNISNRIKIVDGQHHSCYMYVPREDQKTFLGFDNANKV